MKHARRRRHLRPRPTRSQIHHQLRHIGRTIQTFQFAWLVEAQQPDANLARLRFLSDAIGTLRDEATSLGKF
jgi:hypothetical protein